MISSGIKRGLAATAVSALAIAGVPLLASSANAVPNSDVSNIGATDVELVSTNNTGISAKNDGTNTTVSIVANGGSGVTSVQFQAQFTGETTPTNLGAPVARNADGVFAYDWTPTVPVGATDVTITAVANTAATDTSNPVILSNAAANTVELGTEGALGVFQSPYTTDGGADYIGVKGTTSGAGAVDVFTQSGGVGAGDTFAAPAPTAPATTSSFSGILDIDGYNYSAGAEANQLILGAATNNTDDAESSTLYIQTITGITADVDKANLPAGQTATATVTVKDQNGLGVANALVSYTTPPVAPSTTPVEGGTVKRTNANGVATFPGLAAGNYTFYVNKDAAASDAASTYGTGDLAATPIVVTSYTQANTSLVASTVKGYTAFDNDELTGSPNNDFIATLKDQNGNPVANQGIEYSYTFDPAGSAPATTPTAFTAAPGVTDANGQIAIPSPAAVQDTAGTYTLNVRRPNVGGAGLLNGTPVTVETGESEIVWDEGTSANAPVNGSSTQDGALELLSGTPLAGRDVDVNYTASGDSRFAATQPTGTTYASAGHVDVVTGTDGGFSVALTDPTIPPNVTPTPETGVLDAEAPGLGTGDSTNADAQADLTVQFAAAATVTSIDVDLNSIFGGYGPGKPADLDIVVHGADGDTDPANDPILKDVPVTVSVDEGFLTPGAGHNANDDLTLADGHDAPGDEYGFYQNDGADETVSTGDNGEADVAATIEKNAGFDDDGRVNAVITIKAGDTTKTVNVTYDSRNPLNLGDVKLTRADGKTGDATVGDNVGLNLFATDQFGNLAGDIDATITDDSTVADFATDGDFGETRTDFTTSGVGIRAFSDAPATQTLMATMFVDGFVVDNTGGPDYDPKTVSASSDPINWVKAATPPKKKYIALQLRSDATGNKDVLKVNAKPIAEGLVAKVFVDGKKVAQHKLNSAGNHNFKITDKNGDKITTYVVTVAESATTHAAQNQEKIK